MGLTSLFVSLFLLQAELGLHQSHKSFQHMLRLLLSQHFIRRQDNTISLPMHMSTQ